MPTVLVHPSSTEICRLESKVLLLLQTRSLSECKIYHKCLGKGLHHFLCFPIGIIANFQISQCFIYVKQIVNAFFMDLYFDITIRKSIISVGGPLKSLGHPKECIGVYFTMFHDFSTCLVITKVRSFLLLYLDDLIRRRAINGRCKEPWFHREWLCNKWWWHNVGILWEYSQSAFYYSH